MKALLLTAVLATLAVRPSADTTALVAKCVQAYGGAPALRQMKGFIEEGRVTSLLHPGVTGRIARIYLRPGKLRIETEWPDAPGEIRVVDGARGWRNGEEVSGSPLDAMILQAARLDLPVLLSAPGAKVADHGTWSLEGKTLRVLAVAVAPNVEVEAGIDPATGLILRSRGTAKSADRNIEFVTTYSDFRKVGGALFAFHEGNWANGSSTGETNLTMVDVSPKLEDWYFRP